MNLQEITNILKSLPREQQLTIIHSIQQEEIKLNRFQNGYKCPHCQETKIRKFGNARGKQRYLCMTCKKTFTEYTKSVFFSTKKPLNVWIDYIEYMMNGLSLKKICDKLNISKPTAFSWRHKILTYIKKYQENTTVSGIVEADETFLLESHKGVHLEGIKGRKRGGSSKYRGLSFEQVGVLVALDRDKNVISEIYGRGKITTKQISNVLESTIEENSVLVTDSCRSYVKFASDNNLVLKQIERGKHKNGIYHINNVNSYHSGLKDFIRGFKGISTKYLNNYLNWFKWIKSCQSNQDLIKNCLIAV